MGSRKKYALEDFQKFSTGRLADAFARVADIGLYEIVEKAYMNETKHVQHSNMVLLGRYWRKRNGPPVWAHATGRKIRYYSGVGIEVTPLLDIHASRIYYDPPFDYMGYTEDSSSRSSMAQQRSLKRAGVEAVIHFIFLASGRLDRTSDTEKSNLLSNFRSALTNFAQYLETQGTAEYTLDNESSMSSEQETIFQDTASHSTATETTNKNAICKSTSTAVVPAKRTFIDLTDEASEFQTQTMNKRALLAEHLEEHDELERRLKDLTAELRERDRIMSHEKAKRQKLRDQRQKWKDRYMEQQRLLAETTSTSEVIEHEQEDKTEELKLKYVALKEKNKELQTQIAALKAKKSAQKVQLAQHQQHAYERNLKNASIREMLRKQTEELAKEKEARIFWQRKHSGRAGKRSDDLQPRDTSTVAVDQVADMAIVRAKSTQQDVRALQKAYGSQSLRSSQEKFREERKRTYKREQ